MTDSATLTGQRLHPSLDYARLRAEGLQLLGRLAGAQWTDFNAHDPGITILEQLCYAITDLGYRCGHPVADLLAAAADTGLPGPAQALSSDPVTVTDLRRLALDAARADRVSVIPLPQPDTSVCFHEGSREIRAWPDPADITAAPLQLRGVYGVALHFDAADEVSVDAALQALSDRLHARRPLGSDFEFQRLQTLPVALSAQVEVTATDDPTSLLADIIESIDDRLAPPARFQPLGAAGDAGTMPSDVRFEGPLLQRGAAIAMPELPGSIFASDLIHAITNVQQVRAVSAITLTPDFPLLIPAGHVAVLDAAATRIVLSRAGTRLRTDAAAAFATVRDRRRARRAAVTDLPVPELAPGRDRRLATHRSVQHQLPAAYGVGVYGLPHAASPQRLAQTRQLQAYLLVFDQLLANQFGQLAQAYRLLSPDVGGTASYFPQAVDDPLLPLDELLRPLAAAPAGNSAECSPGDIARRRRFLAHLLARQGEGEGSDPPLRYGDSAEPDDQHALFTRQRLLAALPRLNAARGTACNLVTGAPSPLAERIALKYGLARERFELVEHILLRPVVEDANQHDGNGEALPLLDDLQAADPWSQRISVVFRMPAGLAPDAAAFLELHRFVQQAVRAETPAHLGCQLHWLDDAGDTLSFQRFQAAWNGFLRCLRDHRWPAAVAAPGADPQLLQLRLRDARDGIVEMLGLARTYPLRDLPWPHEMTVPTGFPARVVLGYSQRGVDYELRRDDPATTTLLDRQPGTGGELVLRTPPVTASITCRVLAIKPPLELPDTGPPEMRQAWLLGELNIAEGIDRSLVAEVVNGAGVHLLDPGIDPGNARPDDARLAPFGAAVQVLVRGSQEGIVYTLRSQANALADLSAAVTGTGSDILLTLPRATDDIDLRVHAARNVVGAGQPGIDRDLLDAVLRLRVRADPAVAIQLVPGIVAHGGSAGLQLPAGQPGVQYQAWARPVRDSEFRFGAAPGPTVISLAGDSRPVAILRPPRVAEWQDVEGFQPLGGPVNGNGGGLIVMLPPARHDLLLLVQAKKQHKPADLAVDGAERMPSAVQLDAAMALLARPDTAPALRLRVLTAGNGDTGAWLVQGGQPGVAYRLLHDAFPAGLPAYVHQRDALDEHLNKGIGGPGESGLGVELDLALARDRVGSHDVTRAPPPDPLLDAGPVPPGSSIEIQAVKVMSGVGARLARSVVVAPLPAMRAEPAAVAAGGSVALVVAASRADELYTVQLADTTLSGPHAGNGGTLAINVGPLDSTTTFTVIVQRDDPMHLPCERSLQLTVEVH